LFWTGFVFLINRSLAKFIWEQLPIGIERQSRITYSDSPLGALHLIYGAVGRQMPQGRH
jgi:hypothetical protein